MSVLDWAWIELKLKLYQAAVLQQPDCMRQGISLALCSRQIVADPKRQLDMVPQSRLLHLLSVSVYFRYCLGSTSLFSSRVMVQVRF